MSVPVIDLFAGPGGLGEGFSRCKSVNFEVAVSIEKDGMAFETLRLRAAHRALCRSEQVTKATWVKWDKLIADEPWNIVFHELRDCGDSLIKAACGSATSEAWNLELGPDNRDEVSSGIMERLSRFARGRRLPQNAVLIGGPPCQAYSVVGRSRNRGTVGYKPENDHRHFLYREYLQVIEEFRPAVFVMENVKGILTSRIEDKQIFATIMADLKRPDLANGEDCGLEYVLVALSKGTKSATDPAPEDFVVEAEHYGVPQARHRVVILGVRRDVFNKAQSVRKLAPTSQVSVGSVINGLRTLRPQLSYRGRGLSWPDSLNLRIMDQALSDLESSSDKGRRQVARLMERVRARLKRRTDPGHGSDRIVMESSQMHLPEWKPKWFRDRPVHVLANHESRAHMPSDLVRYLFVSAYGCVFRESPKLRDFPASLLPDHQNVDPENVDAAIFKDRFRVQISDRCSMTVTSHIGKDGHAFIHPDPFQCRSLTVREAARLQTFPDSYVFLGNRTSQYTQVGNAVPPLLANQIAEIVAEVLINAGLS